MYLFRLNLVLVLYISVVLDCAPLKPNSQISSSNILHHMVGLIDVPHNDYSMLTRGKQGVLRKK